MSWEEELFALFDDLESQAAAAYAEDRAAELADRSRAEYQQVALAGRLMASVGSELAIGVYGVGLLRGTLERVATGWLLLRSGPGQDWVIREAAVTGVSGASERAVPPVAWEAVARLGLGSALRRLSESGERCVLHLLDGTRYDGTLRRVGADFVEVYAAGRLSLVAFTALAAVQSRD
ncbi:hypothetical protein P5P86_16160 [Nocardioides sp. BP30]|uniref:hypothetical protein n=1 Tax=Nocardioides sp. BP30 TaxID=3036374 RepID=UPI0024689802|nr:hypothetical protein [Nocardioides sp. BP30]WGL51488.1 hypothetical protein P5P86_16160 [Nocardioides sp. BP30]